MTTRVADDSQRRRIVLAALLAPRIGTAVADTAGGAPMTTKRTMVRRSVAAAPARRLRAAPVAVLVRVAPALVSVRGVLAAALVRAASVAVLVRAAPELVLVRGALAADLAAPAADLVQAVDARTIGEAAWIPAAMPAWVERRRAAMAGAAALARRKPPVAPVGAQKWGEMPGLVAVASVHVVVLPLPDPSDSAVVAV
jgi:hypothetical protein